VIKQIAFLLLVFLILGAGANAAPGTIVNNVNNTWQNTDANLQFNCSGTIGCKNFYYSLNDVNGQKGWGTDGNIGIVLNYDYNHEIFYWSDDILDSNEVEKLLYLAIDKTVPITSEDYNAGWNKLGFDQNVKFTCFDANSRCKEIVYKLNGSNQPIYSVPIVIRSEGNNSIAYKSIDNAGNAEDENTLHVLIDGTAPTVSNTLPLTDTNKARPGVSFDVNDSGSGVADGNLFVDGNLVNPTSSALFGTGYHKSWDFNYDLANGTTISVRLRTADSVGNNSGDVNWSFTVDLEAPTSISINGPSITNDSTPTLTLGASDGVSGMSGGKVILSCNGSSWSAPIDYTTSYSSFNITSGNGCDAADGNKTVYARFRDRAGNWNSTLATDSGTKLSRSYGGLSSCAGLPC